MFLKFIGILLLPLIAIAGFVYACIIHGLLLRDVCQIWVGIERRDDADRAIAFSDYAKVRKEKA